MSALVTCLDKLWMEPSGPGGSKLMVIAPARTPATERAADVWGFLEPDASLSDLLDGVTLIGAFGFGAMSERCDKSDFERSCEVGARTDEFAEREGNALGASVTAPVGIADAAAEPRSNGPDASEVLRKEVEDLILRRVSDRRSVGQHLARKTKCNNGSAVASGHVVVHASVLIGGALLPMMAKGGEGGNALPPGPAA